MMARRLMGRGREASRLWTPADTSTVLWLDAADASTISLESSAVAQWADKSGNLRHAVQNTPGARPTVVANSLNNRPVVRLDGTDDFMPLPAISASAGIALYFVVRQRKQSLTRNGGVFSSFETSSHFGAGDHSGNDWYDSFFSNTRYLITATDIMPGDYIGHLKQTGSALFGALYGLIDAQVSATFSTNGQTLGVGTNGSSIFSQNDYAELILVQSPSNATEYLIQGYLAHKWGLAANLPSDHPYKSAAPRV